MKEIVERLLNGQFEYNRGDLDFSTKRIELEINEGEEYEGSFQIVGPVDKVTEGIVSSTELRMVVLNDAFSGEKDEISYRFKSEGLVGGDVINGNFRIISNRGEYIIPYTVTIKNITASSSLGDIRNLFHFANLAKAKWEEALRLFYTPSLFHHILSGNDAQYEGLYRGLVKIPGSESNMEEFLIGISKKQPMVYLTESENIEMILEEGENVDDYEVPVHRSGWGYSKLNIVCDGDFLEVDKTELVNEDFIDGTGYFHIRIDSSKLHSGKNLGRIRLQNISTDIVIPITCLVLNKEPLSKGYHEKKLMTVELMKLYIDFRCRKLNSKQWLLDTGKLIQKMIASSNNDLEYGLYNVQYLVTADKNSQAQFALEQLKPVMEMLDSTKTIYADEIKAYELYLETLISRQEDEIGEVALKIEELYKKNPDSWRIAWLLLYVSNKYSGNSNVQRRFDLLEEQFERGCRSPILYLDAMQCMRLCPALLRVLNDFSLSVLYFATRYGIMTIPVMEQMTYLALRSKKYDKKLYKILKNSYDIHPCDEILEAVCALLIQGDKTDPESFLWYQRGIERQLRVTRLYEYYLLSVTTDNEGRPTVELSKLALMYFSYQSDLNWESNAVLYRYMYEHQDDYKQLYDVYKPQIEQYLLQQIDKGNICPALGFLYQRLIKPSMVNAENASKLLSLLYMNEIKVGRSDITELIVVYDKCRSQMRYKIVDRKAYVPLYGSEYTLILSDDKNHRFCSSVEYEVKKMVSSTSLSELTVPYIQKGTANLDLFLSELSKSAATVTLENAERYRDLVESDVIREDVRAQIRSELIRFYYDNDFMRQLTEYLEALSPDNLNAWQRNEMLELMVLTGMYDKSLDWIKRYGCYKVDPKIIMRLCGRSFDVDASGTDQKMSEISWYAFSKGKYDEATLEFLCKNYQGTVREMRDLYKAAESFGIESWDLLNRTLGQILFTQTYLGDSTTLFKKYVKLGANADLEMAFLAQESYNYFVHDNVVDSYIFERIGALALAKQMSIPIICMEAYLKYFAENKDKEKCDNSVCRNFILHLIEQKLYFSFFKKYLYLDEKMQYYVDKTILEYKSVPHAHCLVHYMMVNQSAEESSSLPATASDYEEIEMKEMADGIYVTDFVLFFGEQVQYYITEEFVEKTAGGKNLAGMQQLTESGTLTGAENSPDSKGLFHLINEMTTAKVLEDEKTLQRMLNDYQKKNALVEEFFDVQ